MLFVDRRVRNPEALWDPKRAVAKFQSPVDVVVGVPRVMSPVGGVAVTGPLVVKLPEARATRKAPPVPEA